MKKLLALGTSIALMMTLAACGKAASSSSVVSSSSLPESSSVVESSSLPESSSVAESVSAPEKKASTGSGQLSDDLADFQIMLNGDVFTVPSTFQDFADKGWTPEKDLATMELEDRQGTSTRMLNGDSYFSVSFANTSGGKQMADLSTIYKIEVVATGSLGPHVDMELAKGITYGASLEDIIAAYGEPDKQNESEDFTILTYFQSGGYHSIDLVVYPEGRGLLQLTLNRIEVK